MNPLKRNLTDHKADRLLDSLDLLRLLDREIPGQVMATFLYVASHNPCHKQALEEDLGFSTASGSRNTDWLSEKHRLKKPGLGLIKKEIDPSNKRRQLLSLTKEGELLISKMLKLLYG